MLTTHISNIRIGNWKEHRTSCYVPFVDPRLSLSQGKLTLLQIGLILLIHSLVGLLSGILDGSNQ
jgi:hypothetical protein